MKRIVKYQQDVLRTLSGRIDDFYLAGGTALSLFYFQHRLSIDLDFFTHDFDYSNITGIAEYLQGVLKKKVKLIGQALEKKAARMAVYSIKFTASDTLKIDFVEDTVELLKKTKTVDGIRVLSLEDIYLRKLYALAGMVRMIDEAGRNKFIGGRADAKDFYDVYFLSHTFMPLSKFAAKYCGPTLIEAIVKWFRTYDRMATMDGVLTLDTDKVIDCKMMERHFKKEVDKMLEDELGEL
ncbi:MAG: nucleotidyl transferase AbiEii/AbiGii toxin family protein [Candidatus Omnitrophica bacterium]|nr:nucleotidyl transferase AbiEii/AbiGii toxin family protein [Candidatus Omnitrophota bacterium]